MLLLFLDAGLNDSTYYFRLSPFFFNNIDLLSFSSLWFVFWMPCLIFLYCLIFACFLPQHAALNLPQHAALFPSLPQHASLFPSTTYSPVPFPSTTRSPVPFPFSTRSPVPFPSTICRRVPFPSTTRGPTFPSTIYFRSGP